MHGLGSFIWRFFLGLGFLGIWFGFGFSFSLCAGRSGVNHRADSLIVWVWVYGSAFWHPKVVPTLAFGFAAFSFSIRIPLLYLYRDQIQIDLYLLQSS